MILPLPLLLLLQQQQLMMRMRRRRTRRTRTRTKRTLPPRVALALYTTSPPLFFPPPGILVFGFSGFLTVAHPASDELVIFSSIPCQTLIRAGVRNLKVWKGPFRTSRKSLCEELGVSIMPSLTCFPRRKHLSAVPSPPTSHVTTATKMQQLLVLLESSNPPTKGLRLRPYALDLRP